jgi:hypothetical protein
MVPYYLFHGYRILGGAEAAGLKLLLSVQVLKKNISNENRSIQFLMQELLALCSSGAMNAAGPEGASCVSDQ